LMNPDNQREVASAMLKAFSQYKREYEKGAVTVAPPAVADAKADTPQTPATGSIARDQVKTGQVVYRIQVAASSRSNVDPKLMSLDDLEVIREGEMYKFLVGFFTSAEAAKQRLSA